MLERYLIEHCSPTLANIKTANLFSCPTACVQQLEQWNQMLQGKGIALSCPDTTQLCCYIGEEGRVNAAMRELEITAEKMKQKKDEPEAFTDSLVMYEVLSELKEIAGRGGISCACGSRRYSMDVRPGAVDLVCRDCGAKLRIPAATDRDLDDLCCHMKLVIPGRR